MRALLAMLFHLIGLGLIIAGFFSDAAYGAFPFAMLSFIVAGWLSGDAQEE